MPRPPVFQASLLTVVGEGRQLTIAVTASTHEELAGRVAHAHAIAQQQLVANNARVLSAVDEAGAASEARFARAVRAICQASGLPIPEEYAPASNGHDAQEGGPHAHPDRAADAPADS